MLEIDCIMFGINLKSFGNDQIVRRIFRIGPKMFGIGRKMLQIDRTMLGIASGS